MDNVTMLYHCKDANELIKLINKNRRNDKSIWYALKGTVHGMPFSIKFFDTWVQRLAIGDSGTMHSSPADIKVSTLKAFIIDCVDYELNALSAQKD